MKDPKLIIAPSNADSDVFYATHFSAPGDTILLQLESGKKIMIADMLEYGRAKKTTTGIEVLLDDELVPREPLIEKLAKEGIAFTGAEQVIEAVTKVVRESGANGVIVPGKFPFKAFKLLERRGIEVSYIDSPFWPEREIKTNLELEYIKEGQRVNEKAMAKALEMIANATVYNGKLDLGHAWLTSERIKYELDKVYREGGYSNPDGMVVACGDQGCDPHNPGSGTLMANQTIVIDLFPRSLANKYWADMTRTVVKGEASDEVKKMYVAVYEAKHLAKKLIKGGALGKDVYVKVRDFFEGLNFPKRMAKEGMEGFIHGVGHGFGLDIHESPLVGMSNDILKAGSVVTVEPGLYYFGVGAVRLEDFVIIREGYCETVTDFPEVLEIP